MKIALLMLIFLATASPVSADDPQITCATVRAYVSSGRFHAGQGAGSCRRADSGATTESKGVPCEQGLISPRKVSRMKQLAGSALVLKLFPLNHPHSGK